MLQQSTAALIGADSMTEFIEHRREDVRWLIERVDILFLTATELAALTGEDDWRVSASGLCGTGRLRAVVVKHGPHGAACVTAAHIIERPAAPVARVVDPTGAGDALAGGFLGFVAKLERSDDATFAVGAGGRDSLRRRGDRGLRDRWAERDPRRMIAGEWQRGRAIWEPRSIATLPSNWSGSPKAPRWRPPGTWGGTRRSRPTRPRSNSMRRSLGFVDMDGVVVIGEGEKDEAPMLYIGEQVGNGNPPAVDVAVDPIDGTRLVARGIPGGIATVALAERGSMFHTHLHYIEKLIVGPAAAKVIDITASVAQNLKRIAKAEDRSIEDLTVVVLDRERHETLLDEIRSAGARVKLIMDGDVAAGPHGRDGAPHRHRRADGHRRRP